MDTLISQVLSTSRPKPAAFLFYSSSIPSPTPSIDQLSHQKRLLNTTNLTWNHKEKQIQFFKDLEAKLQIKKPEDWYKVTGYKILEFSGGATIMRLFNNSLIRALMALFPHYNLQVCII